MVESQSRKLTELEKDFSDKLFFHLECALVSGPLTYGFEYEFIPESQVTPELVAKIKIALPEMGFQVQTDGSFKASDGLDVSFEPGGQLEYGSPPLLAADGERFVGLLDHLLETNRVIAERFGVSYVAIDYAPEREFVPLCIDGQRYLDMHSLFTDNGGRGREMMKGTASIQLHVRLRSMAEVAPLFKLMTTLAQAPDFAMSPTRRAIWNATDSSRCLLPEHGDIREVKELLSLIVRHALQAVDFNQRVSFADLKEPSFDQFLVHLTTIFTDVRLNFKGPTFELRTMDSLPVAKFKNRWQCFIDEVERVVPSKE